MKKWLLLSVVGGLLNPSVIMAAQYPHTPSWHFQASLKPITRIGDYVLLPAEQEDFQKVLQCYQHHPVPGYDIKSVTIIYNPSQNMIFSRKLPLLQNRSSKTTFNPTWQQENDPAWRAEVDQQWKRLAAPHTDHAYPAVKLLPLWHGTRPEIMKSIFETGYANLATTDDGYFGKGLYSTHEAEYAFRVYSRGSLLLNWVAMYSAYPVIAGDEEILMGGGNKNNYDAHFVPVRPHNPEDPNEAVYLPCVPGQKSTYTEVVVFDPGNCLPRYMVELQPVLTSLPGERQEQIKALHHQYQMALQKKDDEIEQLRMRAERAELALVTAPSSPPQTTPPVPVCSLPQPVPGGGLVLPAIARGYEEIYSRFMNGKLIYKQGQPDQVVLPFAQYVNPETLEGMFNLTGCGDAGQYLSIYIGYRKRQILENNIEVWIVPRLLFKQELSGATSTFFNIMTNSLSQYPLCVLFNKGNWALNEFYYNTLLDIGVHRNKNLYNIFVRSRPDPRMPWYHMHLYQASCHKHTRTNFQNFILI